MKELRRWIAEIAPDHLVVHYSYSLGLVSYLALRKLDRKIRFSVVCHGSDVLSPPKPRILFSLVNRLVLRKADKIFAVSNQIYDRIISWGIEREKIFVGQYGVRLPDFQHGDRDIDILSTRAYTENSQIHEMLSALDTEFFRERKIVFILPKISDTGLERLKGLYPHIEFLRQMAHKKVIDMLCRAKIYISATKSDGTSLSLLEAMAGGCMPVVSNIPANTEVKLPASHYFQVKDVEDLAKKLQSAIYKKWDAVHRNGAREFVRKKYNWDEISDQTLAVYRKALTVTSN